MKIKNNIDEKIFKQNNDYCKEYIKMNKKIIIWDLFGGLRNSVYRALENDNCLVFTFDIIVDTNININSYKINLSNDNVIELLKMFPKPDYIFSSPPCDSFSSVLFLKNGGTCCWTYNDNKTLLIERKQNEFEKLKSGFTKNFKWENQLEKKRLGKKLIDNTMKIIEYFKPKCWYIENPKHSLMWKYIKLNCNYFLKQEHYFNKVCYINYGFPINKPTIFLSNQKINLKDKLQKIKLTPKKIWYRNKYNSSAGDFNYLKQKYRSTIPSKLIQEIYKQLEKMI